MIPDDVLMSRYPTSPPPPAAYSGWRRKKREERWEKVVDSAPTKGQCYERLIALGELVGDENQSGEYQYAILPAGEDANRRFALRGPGVR